MDVATAVAVDVSVALVLEKDGETLVLTPEDVVE